MIARKNMAKISLIAALIAGGFNHIESLPANDAVWEVAA